MSFQLKPLSLADINADEELQLEFTKYTKKEQSYESVLFLDNIRKFKSLTDNVQIINKAVDISQTFLTENSECEINVDRPTCDLIQKFIKNTPEEIHTDLFDPLANEVSLTLQDTILRFNNSNRKLSFIRQSLVSMEQFPMTMSTDFLSTLIDKISHKDFGFDVRNRSWRLKVYPNVFVCSEAVDYMTRNKFFEKLTRDMAVSVLSLLTTLGVFRHCVENEKIFSDDFLFFRFTNMKKELILKNYVDMKIVRRKLRNDDLILDFWHDLTNAKTGIEIKDREYNLKVYPACFLGSECVDWICQYYSIGKDAAKAIGNQFISMGMFSHVTNAHGLKDEYLFYHLGQVDFEEELRKWRGKFTPRSLFPYFPIIN
jgi:hypothetical protein